MLAAAFLLGAMASPTVELTEPVVRLRDVIDLAALPAPLRARAAEIAVARLSVARAIVLTRTYVLARAHAQMPLLSRFELNVPADAIHVRYLPNHAQAQQNQTSACLKAVGDIAAGQVVKSSDFVPADCELPFSSRAFRFDASRRAVLASRSIAAGEITARFSGFGQISIYAGQAANLVTKVGSITVSREVEAIQSGRVGQAMFVRTADGQLMSIRAGEEK